MLKPLTGKIIAVDFDGTLCEHRYPDIGFEVPGAIDTLKWLQGKGARLILWTMRSGDRLQEAVNWCQERGIEFSGVNLNPDQHTWTDSPKAYAHVYIDDAALGCPVVRDSGGKTDMVEWGGVRLLLRAHFASELILR